jgi:hypothetical protein
VLVADSCDNAEFPHAAEYVSSNMRTVRPITQILRKQFFPPVRSREARLDRYLRNGESPNRILILSDG